MGLRFACPNGHPLHVKEELAGKRGICPDCQVRFWIPLASEVIPGSKELLRAQSAPDAVPVGASTAAAPSAKPPAPTNGRQAADQPSAKPSPVARAAQQPTPPAADPTPPAPAPAATPPTAPAPPNPVASTPVESPAPLTTPPPPPPPAAAAPAQPEPPPKEVEQSEWYIRPATGGLYGPADEQLMHQWIEEGRVGPDSHVWRTGWPDWKHASEIPDLLPGLASSPATPTAVELPSGYTQPKPKAIDTHATSDPHDPSVMAARYQRRKRKAAAVQQLAAILLGVLVLILGIVLVWVVARANLDKPTPEPSTAPSTVPMDPEKVAPNEEEDEPADDESEEPEQDDMTEDMDS